MTINDIIEDIIQRGIQQKLRGFDKISSIGKQYLAENIQRLILINIEQLKNESK